MDLIRRQQSGPVRIPSANEMATVQLTDELLGGLPEQPADRPRGWLARSAKLAGLALGSLALCGSVYAASTLTHHTTESATGTTTGQGSTVLTGIGALRPDTLAGQLGATDGSRARQAPTKAPVNSIATGRATGSIAGRSTASATTTSAPPPATEHASGGRSPADLVRTFYRLVATDPDLASQLLSPALLHGAGSGFDDAWAALSGIQVESVRQVSAHSVEAVVRLREPDGTWLRVAELLHVTDGDHPLINGAELLSAQRG
ncbi:MAG TPA: hypothetical protein VHV49_18440 [Pseudonocardiaceae bacterium]|nr:hypothetical protein [Pseudonocardiaceae bacterium]